MLIRVMLCFLDKVEGVSRGIAVCKVFNTFSFSIGSVCKVSNIYLYIFYSWPTVQEIRRKEGVDLRGNPFHVLRTYYSLSHTGI